MTAIDVCKPPKRSIGNGSSQMKTNRMMAYFLLAFGLAINTAFQPVAADERIGTMPGTAAPRTWRTNTPEGFLKHEFCFKDVCIYDRIVARKGDIVVTDRMSERGEPRYEYFEIKKTQYRWNCRDGSMGWRNYKRLKSDQGTWAPWHWGAWRDFDEKYPESEDLKLICQNS